MSLDERRFTGTTITNEHALKRAEERERELGFSRELRCSLRSQFGEKSLEQRPILFTETNKKTARSVVLRFDTNGEHVNRTAGGSLRRPRKSSKRGISNRIPSTQDLTGNELPEQQSGGPVTYLERWDVVGLSRLTLHSRTIGEQLVRARVGKLG